MLKAKIQGIARQTSQIPASEKDVSDAYLDDLGRQLFRYQVRDLINTAYVSLSTGTKTSLIAGESGVYFDLFQISCANNSDAATVVTLTDESTEVMAIPVPANQATNLYFQIPLKQSAKGVAWYVDLPDITGTTISVNAVFSKEV